MKTKEEIEKIYNERYGEILPSSKYTSKESFIEGYLACQEQQSDAVAILEDIKRELHAKGMIEAMDIVYDKITTLHNNQYNQKIEDEFNICTKAHEPLDELEDLWRAENPRPKFTIPDRTEFCKWIVNKIKEK